VINYFVLSKLYVLVSNRIVIQDSLKFSLSRSAFFTYVISKACLGSVKISFTVSNVISNNISFVPLLF
jgi:hypothetical protein